MIYRYMQSADLPEVATLLRNSFSPRMRPYMAYTQHGIGSFLAARLAHPQSFPQQFFGVATDESERVLGYAEFTMNSQTEAHLSYICVSEDARRLGVAKGLIAHFCESRTGMEYIALDVFADNSPAVNLYRTLGFTSTGEGTTWLSRRLPPASAELKVSHLTTACAAHGVYGFCEFHVDWNDREMKLGRIGLEILRCFSLEEFGDHNLLAAVRATFPDVTQALVIVASCDLDAEDTICPVIVESTRMKVRVGTVMDRVSGNA